MPFIAPVPLRHTMATDPKEGLVSRPWVQWLDSIRKGVSNSAGQIGAVGLAAQTATIATEPLSTPALVAGRYRLSYVVQVTRAATTSSSIQPVFTWVSSGATLTYTGTALTGNTVTTYESNTFLITADAGSAVTYHATYASVGATAMQFSLNVQLEQLP